MGNRQQRVYVMEMFVYYAYAFVAACSMLRVLLTDSLIPLQHVAFISVFFLFFFSSVYLV